MIHLDLFSGIGGFAYAIDQVWDNVEHIFCDNEPFAQQVLKKHWPESEIFDDIRDITDTKLKGLQVWSAQNKTRLSGTERGDRIPSIDLLTGGFPCQPFSAAGLRRGTADDRHLWPEMLRVIQLTQPTWIIAENVRGILTWNGGLVFEQVCTDLEAAGYEVQPLIIPAVAVNAPHRRDRVWFIAHAISSPDGGTPRSNGSQTQKERVSERDEVGQLGESGQVRDVANTKHPGDRTSKDEVINNESKNSEQRQHSQLRDSRQDSDATNIGRKRWIEGSNESLRPQGKEPIRADSSISSWERDWSEVAAEFCSMDDGLPVALDGFELSKSQHRKEQLKAYGNAIVPAVAVELMKAIRSSDETM